MNYRVTPAKLKTAAMRLAYKSLRGEHKLTTAEASLLKTLLQPQTDGKGAPKSDVPPPAWNDSDLCIVKPPVVASYTSHVQP